MLVAISDDRRDPSPGVPDEVRERLEALARSPDSLTLIPPRTAERLAQKSCTGSRLRAGKLQRHIGPATGSPIAVTARLRDQEM